MADSGVAKTQWKMPDMEQKEEQPPKAKEGVTNGTPVGTQGDTGAQLAVTHLKAKMEELVSQATLEWIGAAGVICPPGVERWRESTFLLSYLGPKFAQTYGWRERRASEWEGLVGQKHLTMCISQSVEQLRERFSSLDMQEGELTRRLDPTP